MARLRLFWKPTRGPKELSHVRVEITHGPVPLFPRDPQASLTEPFSRGLKCLCVLPVCV